LSFLAALGPEELERFLIYYGLSEEDATLMRRWRDLFLAGNIEQLAAQVNEQRDCGGGDWSM
jgi:hypothetical protein